MRFSIPMNSNMRVLQIMKLQKSATFLDISTLQKSWLSSISCSKLNRIGLNWIWEKKRQNKDPFFLMISELLSYKCYQGDLCGFYIFDIWHCYQIRIFRFGTEKFGEISELKVVVIFLLGFWMYCRYVLKLRFSEKATKIWRNRLLLTLLSNFWKGGWFCHILWASQIIWILSRKDFMDC